MKTKDSKLSRLILGKLASPMLAVLPRICGHSTGLDVNKAVKLERNLFQEQ